MKPALEPGDTRATNPIWDEAWEELLDLCPRAEEGADQTVGPLKARAWRAWQARRRTSAPILVNSLLSDTMSVTVTGDWCALNCAHCGGHYLATMHDIKELDGLNDDELPGSCLISGGCDPDGVVPLWGELERLRALAPKVQLNLHAGLVNEEQARLLSEISAAVSFDFIADGEAIRGVYGLNRMLADYEKSYAALRRYGRVVPHVTIGLNGGRPSGESGAIDALRRLGVDRLVFIIFRPTRGTLFADRQPPPLGFVAGTFLRARAELPDVPLNLGCMRPSGRYRTAVDLMAVLMGFDTLVLATPPALSWAARLGIEVVEKTGCCAL